MTKVQVQTQNIRPTKSEVCKNKVSYLDLYSLHYSKRLSSIREESLTDHFQNVLSRSSTEWMNVFVLFCLFPNKKFLQQCMSAFHFFNLKYETKKRKRKLIRTGTVRGWLNYQFQILLRERAHDPKTRIQDTHNLIFRPFTKNIDWKLQTLYYRAQFSLLTRSQYSVPIILHRMNQ